MPTAINVDAEEAITPPNVAKKKKNDDDSEGSNKITPAPSSSTADKSSKQEKAQPSIMNFFNNNTDVSTRNLFSKKASTKKSPLDSQNSKDDDDEMPPPSNEQSSQEKRSSIPTAEEVRKIVIGSATTNPEDLVVPTDLPPMLSDCIPSSSSLFPPISLRNPGLKVGSTKTKSSSQTDEPVKQTATEEAACKAPEMKESKEKESTNADAAPDSINAPVKESSEEKTAVESNASKKESVSNDCHTETEAHDSNNDDEKSQSDDDTVDMSPVTQVVAKETTAPKEKSVPLESTTTNQEETSKADESIDLTADDDDAAAASMPKESHAQETKPPHAKKPAPMKPATVPESVPAERRAAFTKNQTLRMQYQSRLAGLIQRAHDGLEEENFELPALTRVETLPEEGTTVSSPLEFPDCAITSLALLVQESRLPLTDLAATCLIQLKDTYPDGVEFHVEGIASKIKLLAKREAYVQINSDRVANAFEDENANRMWRWEIDCLDLLPDESVAKIKKARTQRKKIRAHSKALCTLLKHLDQAAKHLQDPKSSQSKCDDVATKISSAEEKVLKYEREEEKVRLAAEAKKKKAAGKSKQQNKKQTEKSLAAEQKKREKALAAEKKKKERASAAEQKKKEKEQKKQEREEKKRKKEEEKQKAEMERERKIKKQRTMMESFFTSSAKKTKKSTEPKEKPVAAPESSSAGVDDLWSRLKASDQHVGGPVFPKLLSRAIASRKRRTRIVSVDVFATIMPSENAFEAQPYAELQTIRVPNKYKFLSFREDYRPPYHGTWSKSSSLVTGRKPTAKDPKYLDYDVDSEAEWEEGDDEIGEDCEADGPDDEDNMDDEEGDTRMYNYQDGWLAADDDLGIDDEDLDEDTKLLREKKLQARNAQQKALTDQVTICIIAPGKGGVPSDDIVENVDDAAERIEGVNQEDARGLLMQHTGTVLGSEGLYLDAFPPPLAEEGNLDAASTKKSGAGKASSSNEMSRSDLIAFIEFVHHSKFPSKDKLVEELRTVHENITQSRAQATRKLDAIAEKKRYPGGVYWEVKREVLEELGLEELLKKELDLPTPKPASEKKAAKKKKTPPSDSTEDETPAPTKSSKKKAPPSVEAKLSSPSPSKKEATTSAGKSPSKKKRPAPSAASVQLFANFLKKKPKTQE